MTENRIAFDSLIDGMSEFDRDQKIIYLSIFRVEKVEVNISLSIFLTSYVPFKEKLRNFPLPILGFHYQYILI